MIYYNLYMLKINLKITIAKLLSILCAKIIILLHWITTTITYLLHFLLIA